MSSTRQLFTLQRLFIIFCSTDNKFAQLSIRPSVMSVSLLQKKRPVYSSYSNSTILGTVVPLYLNLKKVTGNAYLTTIKSSTSPPNSRSLGSERKTCQAFLRVSCRRMKRVKYSRFSVSAELENPLWPKTCCITLQIASTLPGE